MARQRKWASEAERLASYRARTDSPKRTDSDSIRTDSAVCTDSARTDSFVAFRHQAHVPLALFDGFGRGTIRRHTDGRDYVLVSRHVGPDVGELGVVSADDWTVRLGQRCEHGQAGWACHRC